MQKFWKYKVDHIFFWIITIGFHVYTRLFLISQAGFGAFAFEIIIRNSLLALVIYANQFVLIPHLFQKKRFLSYGLILTLSLLLYAILKNVHDGYVYSSLAESDHPLSHLNNIFYHFAIALFYVAFSVGIQLSKAWFFQRAFIRQMEVEKLNTEIAYLKNQINPHFLFNSLNTVYFQIDKNNPEARNTLSQFSEMLRFQLYDCNSNLIPLEKEINYLKNYVELQRLRKEENYKIDFIITGDLKEASIAPLLLIPFVENAFKHISHFTEKTNKVLIEMKRNDDTFSMLIRNTKDNNPGLSTNGIGLKNAKRRLELQYFSKHTLNIKDTNEEFEVNLKLKLA